jgi:AraC-like DNA-binding protein
VLSALVEVAGIFKEQRRGMPQLSRSHREHARLILDNHLADPPAVSELARIVGLNETSLRQAFKAAFGSTIIDYLRDRRLEVARERERRLSIAEIGYRVDFSSPANFATAYRRARICNPSKSCGRAKEKRRPAKAVRVEASSSCQ